MAPELRELEAVLFLAARPLPPAELSHLLGAPEEEVERRLEAYRALLERERRGFELVRLPEGVALAASRDLEELAQRVTGRARRPSLPPAALEVLACIAYHQPIDRHAIEEMRGVRSDRPLALLAALGLIAPVGRGDGPGRPVLFGTTPLFLRWFGLKSLEDLPRPDAAGS